MTVWAWAALATGYVLMLRPRQRRQRGFVVSVLVTWAIVAVATVISPVLETGTDPTQIPLVASLAPILGAIATSFAALDAARGDD